MKKARNRKKSVNDDMLDEYELGPSRPNPYAKHFAGKTIVVVLDKDVAGVFPDAKSVNRALRAMRQIISLSKRKGRNGRSNRKRAEAGFRIVEGGIQLSGQGRRKAQ